MDEIDELVVSDLEHRGKERGRSVFIKSKSLKCDADGMEAFTSVFSSIAVILSSQLPALRLQVHTHSIRSSLRAKVGSCYDEILPCSSFCSFGLVWVILSLVGVVVFFSLP